MTIKSKNLSCCQPGGGSWIVVLVLCEKRVCHGSSCLYNARLWFCFTLKGTRASPSKNEA